MGSQGCLWGGDVGDSDSGAFSYYTSFTIVYVLAPLSLGCIPPTDLDGGLHPSHCAFTGAGSAQCVKSAYADWLHCSTYIYNNIVDILAPIAPPPQNVYVLLDVLYLWPYVI